MAWIPIACVFVVVGLVMLVQLYARKKAHACLANMAARSGLEFVPAKGWTGGARVTGSRHGKSIEFFNYSTGAGKTRKYWSAISAAVPARGTLTFSLCRRNFGTKLRSFFGAKSIRVGDAAFDARWFIQTNQPDFLRAALIPELRQALDAACDRGLKGGTFKQEAGVVRYAEQG
ncbi:MAG TPA: hypothetical protein VIM44_06260, partial [Rariglobus sp.]